MNLHFECNEIYLGFECEEIDLGFECEEIDLDIELSELTMDGRWLKHVFIVIHTTERRNHGDARKGLHCEGNHIQPIYILSGINQFPVGEG